MTDLEKLKTKEQDAARDTYCAARDAIEGDAA